MTMTDEVIRWAGVFLVVFIIGPLSAMVLLMVYEWLRHLLSNVGIWLEAREMAVRRYGSDPRDHERRQAFARRYAQDAATRRNGRTA